MNKNHLIVYGLLVILCSSCYTYKIYPKEYRKLQNEHSKRLAYLENDTLNRELKILKSSEIFEIVGDSTKADITIKLYPLEKSFVCGQPMIISLLTIGQFPVLLPDRYLYKFDEIQNGKITERKIELKIAKRIWFWDMFAFNKNFEQKAGKAVLGGYHATEK